MMSSEGAPRANEIVLATSAKTTSSPDGMSRGGGGARASPAPLPASRRGAPGRAPKDGSGAPAGVRAPGRAPKDGSGRTGGEANGSPSTVGADQEQAADPAPARLTSTLLAVGSPPRRVTFVFTTSSFVT